MPKYILLQSQKTFTGKDLVEESSTRAEGRITADRSTSRRRKNRRRQKNIGDVEVTTISSQLTDKPVARLSEKVKVLITLNVGVIFL